MNDLDKALQKIKQMENEIIEMKTKIEEEEMNYEVMKLLKNISNLQKENWYMTEN